MAVQICDPADVFTYLGITSPTAAQNSAMEMICTGLESSVKRFCRWGLVESSLTAYLPLFPMAMGPQVPSAELYYSRPWATGPRNRLQLPSMYVKTITSIYEDRGAQAGSGASDFSSSTLLVAGTDYFLEKDAGSPYSWSGGVIRVGTPWSSYPGTIKAVFVSGFSDSELSNDQNSLRFALIKESAEHWIRRQRMNQAFVVGIGPGSDTSGLLAREKLGDYEVGFHKALTSKEDNDPGSYGLSETLREFLQDCGYVMMNVGV